MEFEIKPREKSVGRKLIEVLLIVSLLSVLYSIVFPPHHHSRQSARRSSCQSNLKQIMLSMKQYLGDYDQIYPLVAVGSATNVGKAENLSTFGWADALEPYRRSPQIFQCPSEKIPPSSNQPAQIQTEGLENRNGVVWIDKTPLQLQYIDYWFNAKMAGVKDEQLENQTQTVALGDGNSSDARYHLWKIPSQWPKDKQSPLYRHLDGANFAFADGHVKWFKAGPWKDGLDSGNASNATFRLKSTFKRRLPHEDPNS